MQEQKLRKLRALRGKVDTTKATNNNLCKFTGNKILGDGNLRCNGVSRKLVGPENKAKYPLSK